MKDHKKYLLVLILFATSMPTLWAQVSNGKNTTPSSIPNLITFWDFQQHDHLGDLTSQGSYQYTLEEMNGAHPEGKRWSIRPC